MGPAVGAGVGAAVVVEVEGPGGPCVVVVVGAFVTTGVGAEVATGVVSGTGPVPPEQSCLVNRMLSIAMSPNG